MSGDFSSFWKDDFHCLRQAGKWITQNLRKDENRADIYQRIETGHDNNLSGLYFEGEEERVRHIGSQTLPTMIRGAMQNAQSNVRMGLAAAARIAWVIVDRHVYLWSFDRGEACLPIESPNGQYIIAVELVAPKKDVFAEPVEWCVVMSTYDTVFLDVLIRFESRDYLLHGPSGSLLHSRTDFRIPTDGVQLAAVVGTRKGRIFLGGDQGQLWEMAPEIKDKSKSESELVDRLNDFYDGEGDLPSMLSVPQIAIFSTKKRKRSDAYVSQPKRKCRRVMYGDRLVSAMLSNIVLKSMRLLGSSRGELSKLLVDDDRNLLYGLTAEGYVVAWKLGTENGATAVGSDGFKVEQVAARYLQFLSRRQNPRMGQSFSFIGSIACAQAGLGGSEGARLIIKAYELANSGNESIKPLKPIGMHIIRPTESKSLSLLVVTASGLRLYISLEQSGLVLRHIRAPPPTQDEQVFADEVKGMKPATTMPGLVSSSCYSKGMFVAASTAIGRGHGETPVTRVVFTSHDDRYKEITKTSDGTKSRGKVGGLSESAVWPLQGSFPAGLVHDMAALPSQPNSLDYLLAHSSTPTEAELSLPLTSAFSPFSSGTSNKSKNQGESTTLTKPIPNLILLGSIMMSAFFGTSLQGRDGVGESRFRVSEKFGSHGFSWTSADKNSKKALASGTSVARSNNAKSVCPRLRPCFLHPQVKPITDLAKQCLEKPTTVVLLNTSGVHFFELDTALSGLTKSFATAQSSQSRSTTNLFTMYGEEEGCSLCLGLVVGIGEAASMAAVREKAKNAAYRHGTTPTLEPIQPGSTTLVDGAATSVEDELVPEGYEFRASRLCCGMALLVARLVRPIWNKPVVVVTEGRKISRLFGESIHTPAKVELLLNGGVAKELFDYLTGFETTIREMFGPAINTVPGVTTSSSEMDIDDVMGDTLLLSGSLQYNRDLLAMNNTEAPLKWAEKQERARLLEEKNIHSMYRLISRLKQLVNLLIYLEQYCTDRTPNGFNLEWGLLHGLTIAQLVETSEGQDRLETLLDNLLTKTPSGRGTRIIDELASKLQRDCFFFFSPASRDAFEGFRRAERAALLPRNSSDFTVARKGTRTSFLEAAKNWHSPALVVGKNSPREKSPLVEAASTLVNLGDVVGVVEVCLTTASNFKKRPSDHTNFVTTYAITAAGDQCRWQAGLYHKRRGPAVNPDQRSPYDPKSWSHSSPGSNRAAHQATEATAQDAIEKCHEVIFKHLSDLLRFNDGYLGLQMLSRALSHQDELFLHSLFSFLFDKGFKHTLYSIEDRSALDWLEEKKSPQDLFEYLMTQANFEKAGAHAYEVAQSNDDMPLVFRIEWLNRAVSSYNSIGGDLSHHPKVQPLTKELNWASLQLRIVEKLESLPEEGQRPEETEIEQLRNKIATPQVLFEDFAAKYGLNEECLYILHACAENQQGVIIKLWRNIQCLAVFPCATSNADVYASLSQFAATNANDTSNMLLFVDPGNTTSVPMFESLEWARDIRQVTVRLGVDLYGTGADFIFPVDFLLSQLEALRRVLTGTGALSPGWSLIVLADSGVPFMDVWNSINNASRQNRFLLNGCDADGTIESISAVCELVEYWLSKVTGDRVADDELSKAKQQGAIATHIAELRDRLLPLAPSAQSRLSCRLDEIETKLELHSFERE